MLTGPTVLLSSVTFQRGATNMPSCVSYLIQRESISVGYPQQESCGRTPCRTDAYRPSSSLTGAAKSRKVRQGASIHTVRSCTRSEDPPLSPPLFRIRVRTGHRATCHSGSQTRPDQTTPGLSNHKRAHQAVHLSQGRHRRLNAAPARPQQHIHPPVPQTFAHPDPPRPATRAPRPPHCPSPRRGGRLAGGGR